MERKRFVSREKIFFVRFSDHLRSLNDGGGRLSVRPAWSKRLWQNHLALMRAWQVSFMVEFCVTTSEFTQEDREKALKAITSNDVDDNPTPSIKIHQASTPN